MNEFGTQDSTTCYFTLTSAYVAAVLGQGGGSYNLQRSLGDQRDRSFYPHSELCIKL